MAPDVQNRFLKHLRILLLPILIIHLTIFEPDAIIVDAPEMRLLDHLS
jgi:hypothetical protein